MTKQKKKKSERKLKQRNKGEMKMKEVTYTRQGDYLIPDLILPEQKEYELGYYARMRYNYLKANKKICFRSLLTSVKLCDELYHSEQRAIRLEEKLLLEMKKQEGITEELKKKDMLLWAQKMNNLTGRVREIVLSETIYN